MTNAPADLLNLRAQIQNLTGLAANDVGIVGDGAHSATGGYHEGRDTLTANGFFHASRPADDPREDYSCRLARDRAGLTLSGSAVDIGAGWKQGRSAWIRWNNLLANAVRTNDPVLSAVRAMNYSPDGSTRWRIDREYGWRVESSSDSVDVHTHIEFYRDTEGRRQAAINRIAALANQAITGIAPVVTSGAFMALTDQQQQDMWEWLALLVDPGTPETGRTTDRFHFPPTVMDLKKAADSLVATLAGVKADVAAIKSAPAATLALSDDDRAAIIAGLQAGVVDALKEALREGTGTTPA